MKMIPRDPKIKIIQCDTRDLVIHTQSRNLYYGKPSEYDYESLMRNNQNELFHPETSIHAVSLCCLVNMMKCKLNGFHYECVKGDSSDWDFPSIVANANVYSAGESKKRAVTWLKPKTILEQMCKEENRFITVFCVLDTDAWIRDEEAFLEFVKKFSTSNATIAMAEDISRSTILNSGCIFIKNNEEGRKIIETIYSSPLYQKYHNVVYHEQSALSEYYLEHKEQFMVLPLNDFNTPCGSVVRHAWLHGLFYKLIQDEVTAMFTKLSLSVLNSTTHTIGNPFLVYDTKAERGVFPVLKKL